MEAGPVSLTSYWRLIRGNRDFRLLWLAQIVSEIGDWLYSIAIYSLLLELTGSAKAVASAVVLQVLPQFFIAPLAGVVNDRLSRRKVMIFADLVRVVIVLGMLLVRTREMVWLVYVLLLMETFMWGFFEPGRSAIIPNLTSGKQETMVANALSSTTWSINLAIGATLGGFIAVLFGRDAVFLINALTFLASAYFLKRMYVDEPHARAAPPLRAVDLVDFSPVLDGIRYVCADKRLLATLLVKTGLGLLGAHWVILPVLGERTFPIPLEGLSPERAAMLGMSVLMGARGIGALVGPLLGGYWAGHRMPRLRLGILLGFGAVSLGYLGLGVSSTIVAAGATVVLAHAGGSLIWVFSTTLLHFQAEDRFRGRVFSADFGFLVITMATVSYISGTAIDLGVTVQRICLTIGFLAVAPAVLWAAVAMPLWKTSPSTPEADDTNA